MTTWTRRRGMAMLLTLVGHEWRRLMTGTKPSRSRGSSGRSSSCSTSGFPAWTATRSPPGCGRRSACKNAVIVAVSGYGQEEDRRRSNEAGFDHHLIKPLDHDALLSLIAMAANVPS